MSDLFKKNILVIGLGSIGERHVRNLKILGCNNIYVLRRRNKEPRTFKLEDYKFVKSINDALSKNISAAIISTPTSSHTEMLITLVEASIPVLLEVPISNSLKGLIKINELAKNGFLNALLIKITKFEG